MSTIKIAMVGNVDSGKSTLTSILTKGGLDDGRGSARKTVFVHPHEQQSGRTSSIATEFIKQDGRNICFIDLCGHERYLKTTLFGLNLFRPDYCLLLVGANMGVSRMTRQHFNTVVALGYPTIVVITKVDLTPKHVLQQTVKDVKTMAKRYSQTVLEVNQTTTDIPIHPKIIPLLLVSNVTGRGLDEIRRLISHLGKVTTDVTTTKTSEPVEFIIDNTYQVKGVGIVVSGFVRQGILQLNGKYQLCLTHSSTQVEVVVKSIRDEQDVTVTQVGTGRHATIFIKSPTKQLRRDDIRRGNVLLSQENCKLSREFVAGVYIFHHQTTIRSKNGRQRGYQCIINCNGARQSAEIVRVNNTDGILRSQDRRQVKFRFVYHSEFVKPGTVFTFREGTTIGVGKVLQV